MARQDRSDALAFMKMHGLGNDFVVLDSRGRPAVTNAALARRLGDRHFGVGFDQLAEIRTDETGQVHLDFWNSDGTRAEACGNATRCVADYLMAGDGAASMTLQTPRGRLAAVRGADGRISVNMGQPELDWSAIPLAREVPVLHLPLEGDPVAVSMGNPHCVFFVDDADAVDLARRGAAIEHHPLYPRATNVEFATVQAPDAIRLRVWERGAGITLACGSGACATLVAANLRGLTGRQARLILDGGELVIDWRDDGVWMTGPTAHVFSGVIEPDMLDPRA